MGQQIILCDGFEVIPPPEMNDLILFGSDGSGSNTDESTLTTEEDGNIFSGDSSPGGGVAEEEWSRPKPFSFYLVKQPVYDDPEIKSKINEADNEIYQCNKHRIDINNTLKSQRAEVSSLYTQMESLVAKSEGYKMVFEEKKKEFDSLQEGLRMLRCSNSNQLCFTKEEIDHIIYIAHYQIEHGSIGLEEDDWKLNKDIEKINEIDLSEDAIKEKEVSVQRVKLMAVEMNEVKMELDAIAWKVKHLNDTVGKIQNKIRFLDLEMAHILEKRDGFYEKIKMLRIKRDKANATFFQSIAVMRKAKELAASRNVSDLEAFTSSEVDRFMTSWNKDKAFRDDYVKRTSLSLYERQLSREGRRRDTEVRGTQMPVKAVHQTSREDSSSNSSQDGNVVVDKRKKERKKSMDFNKSSAAESDVIDMEFEVYESPKKEVEEVDEETLKERKREEQLEKARLAMERKRKLQEKAAAKAVIRAQKEAEKKLEKKAKKKTASPPSESDRSGEVMNEMENVKSLAVSVKEKQRSLFPKQRSFRYKHRGRGGTEALPKVILNRRKAQKYWMWGVSSAALALAVSLGVLLLW